MGGEVQERVAAFLRSFGRWIGGWGKGRFIQGYRRTRNLSRSLAPSSVHQLNLYFVISLFLHLLLALFLYSLPSRVAVPLEKPPIAVRILDLKEAEWQKPEEAVTKKAAPKQKTEPRVAARPRPSKLPKPPVQEVEPSQLPSTLQPKALSPSVASPPSSPTKPKVEPLLAGKGGSGSPRKVFEDFSQKTMVAPPRVFTPGEAVEGAEPKVVGGGRPVAQRGIVSEVARLEAGREVRRAASGRLAEVPVAAGKPEVFEASEGGGAGPKAVGGGKAVVERGSMPPVARLEGSSGARVERGRQVLTRVEVEGPAQAFVPGEASGGAGPKAVGGGGTGIPKRQGKPTVTPLGVEGGAARGGRGGQSLEELAKGEEVLSGFRGPADVKVPKELAKATDSGKGQDSGLELVDVGDPDFTAYFEMVKKRVYDVWRYPQGVEGVHRVSLRFRLDQAGGVHDVRVIGSEKQANSQWVRLDTIRAKELNDSAISAMERASPFPPIPEKFKALVGKPLVLIFTVTVK